MLARADDDEADAGPRHAAPERLCVASRTVKPVNELIRFVIGPDQAVVPDVKRRLPGRGVWVTARRGALATAIARGAFGRSFKRDVRVAGDLADTTERLLERAVFDALAIAHKARRVVLGFAKVEAALAGEPVAALLHAADGSPDGVRKLAAAARHRFGPNGIPVVEMFTNAQLDLALGRANVIHAALLAGPETDGFLARYRTLEGFRAPDDGARGGAARG